MRTSHTTLSLIIAAALWLMFSAHALAQGPIVVDAVDDDPANKLWNCETNRVPFGNQETDRSRCFTFRYQVPPEGIKGATLHITMDTLGSLQDTDATIVAVAEPVENCAWGQGNMAGCVVLHGGFKGGEKSLNLDLRNIACDPSIPNTPEAQDLVRQALQTGVLHMELQDDTAVYKAQLVLNGDEPAFPCGTSEQEAATFIPTPGSAAPTSNPNPSPNPNTITQFPFAKEINQILTGTTDPAPPNQSGAATAAVAGAIVLAIFAAANYFLSSNSFVKSALEKAGRRQAPAVTTSMAAASAPASNRSGAGDASARAHDTSSPRPQPGGTSSSDSSAASATNAASPGMSAGGSAGSPGLSADAASGAPSPQLDANSGAGVGVPGSRTPTSSDFAAASLAASADEGISSIPDTSDLVKDKLIDDEAKREKRRIFSADKKRLVRTLEIQERQFNQTRDDLKRVIDSGGNFDAAQKAWRQAEHELTQTRAELDSVNKQLAALDEKPKKE